MGSNRDCVRGTTRNRSHRRESAFPAKWRKSCGKARAGILRISVHSHLPSALCGDTFLFGLCAQASSHCAPNVGPLPRHEGDHFQPHYRMPFALMSGRKDGLFFVDLAASHCPFILWLSAAPPASYANVGGCGIQNANASSNHTPSASSLIGRHLTTPTAQNP